MNTEQLRADLLPCPFCGGADLKLFGEYAPEWWVCCETCKAATQTRANKSQAIEDWNRRAALQSQPKTDPSEWLKQHEALMHRVSKAAIVVGYGGTINGATAEHSLEHAEKALLDHARTLQSQDMKPVIEALETAQNNECGPRRPWGSADPDSDEYAHDAFMWDYYQRAIDHARRIEGET